MTGYIYSNYIVRISMKEKIYVALNKKGDPKAIEADAGEKTTTALWYGEVLFGWDVPLYQRPQHIFTNFAKQRTLVLYEVTRFTDDVKGSKDSQKIFTLSIL